MRSGGLGNSGDHRGLTPPPARPGFVSRRSEVRGGSIRAPSYRSDQASQLRRRLADELRRLGSAGCLRIVFHVSHKLNQFLWRARKDGPKFA